MRLCVLVCVGVFASCGRWGYSPDGNDIVLFADHPGAAFDGATLDGVVTSVDGAHLDITDGFAVQPTYLPSPMAGGAAVGHGENLIIAGGASTFPSYSNCTASVLSYELGEARLVHDNDLPVRNQGNRVERDSNGHVYSIMGYCNTDAADEETVWRVNGDVSLVGRFPVAAYYFTSGVVTDNSGQDVILAAGGYGSGPLRNTLQMLDPGNGAARQLSVDLPSPRCMPAGASVGDELFVFGGNTDTNCELPASAGSNALTDEIVAVTLSPDTAEVVAHLPEPLAAACALQRADGSILILGGVRYVSDGAGGVDRVVSDTMIRFDPTTRTVETLTSTMDEPRAGMACGEANGRVLVAGGMDASFAASDTIQLFEPYAELGTITSPPIDARATTVRWEHLLVDADLPTGASMSMSVRVSDDQASLAQASWLDLGTSALLPDTLERGRYLQWRASLFSDTGSTTPVLRSVAAGF